MTLVPRSLFKTQHDWFLEITRRKQRDQLSPDYQRTYDDWLAAWTAIVSSSPSMSSHFEAPETPPHHQPRQSRHGFSLAPAPLFSGSPSARNVMAADLSDISSLPRDEREIPTELLNRKADELRSQFNYFTEQQRLAEAIRPTAAAAQPFSRCDELISPGRSVAYPANGGFAQHPLPDYQQQHQQRTDTGVEANNSSNPFRSSSTGRGSQNPFDMPGAFGSDQSLRDLSPRHIFLSTQSCFPLRNANNDADDGRPQSHRDQPTMPAIPILNRYPSPREARTAINGPETEPVIASDRWNDNDERHRLRALHGFEERESRQVDEGIPQNIVGGGLASADENARSDADTNDGHRGEDLGSGVAHGRDKETGGLPRRTKKRGKGGGGQVPWDGGRAT
nr:uncharacterized protein CTRU02_15086 [Colletotrichum truncatum]KAF6781446.1 hypothetical protein CTRU02_15086 [Colletotrichum truncatum]